MVDDGHWVRWHAGYGDPASSLSRRLAVVQRRLGDALDQAERGPIKLIGMCAGQGRDVIEVLRGHRRRDWIEGWYNTRRLHSSLGYLSPARYEALIHQNANIQAA